MEYDAVVSRALAGSFSIGGRELYPAAERGEVLERVARQWPEQPSPLLRLAAVARHLDQGLDERFAGAPQQLAGWAGRDPWSVTPEEGETLALAGLVCLEQIEYASFVPSFDTPMVLRDALTGLEDLSAIAAMVRWESLERGELSTPDRLLQSWRRQVSSLAREGHSGLDSSEYFNLLDIRGHLQRFCARLSWAGQAQWREHIEPVDEAFRGCTERQEVPLALTGSADPGGWWRYRLPPGAKSSDWKIWPIEPTRYVAGGHGGGLRTISHVWELAERPYGLRAMTDQELASWARLTGRQAEAIVRREPQSDGGWADRHERVLSEQRRRAADRDDRSD